MFKLLGLDSGEVGSMLVVVFHPCCKTLGRSPLSPVPFLPLMCKVGETVIIFVIFWKYCSYRLKKACGIIKAE